MRVCVFFSLVCFAFFSAINPYADKICLAVGQEPQCWDSISRQIQPATKSRSLLSFWRCTRRDIETDFENFISHFRNNRGEISSAFGVEFRQTSLATACKVMWLLIHSSSSALPLSFTRLEAMISKPSRRRGGFRPVKRCSSRQPRRNWRENVLGIFHQLIVVCVVASTTTTTTSYKVYKFISRHNSLSQQSVRAHLGSSSRLKPFGYCDFHIHQTRLLFSIVAVVGKQNREMSRNEMRVKLFVNMVHIFLMFVFRAREIEFVC